MAKVLEALVARGRRVDHPREQRDVAFGLADLSTHEEMHHRIVLKGGIKTLFRLLKSSDVETQRFAALSLANTASAEAQRIEIARQENSVLRLTQYIADEGGGGDLICKQYCVMALGNLAAEPENHIDIVKLGGIDALVSFLKLGAADQNLDSGRYAAFALSNLAANVHNRKQIVEQGAVEPLILFACLDDLKAQKHALSALRGICICYEHRFTVVQLGILDPLVLMARSDNTEVLREVAAALNCLSAVPENKEEISDRAISTIIALLLSEDMEVERHACCAIANLVEKVEIHKKFLDENGLSPLVSMFSSQDLCCRGEASRAIANLSINADIHKHLVYDGLLNSLVDALKKDEVNCQRFSALCLANLATNAVSQIKVVQAGGTRPLIYLVSQKESQLEARRYAALALANLSATFANHPVMLEEGALEALFSLSNSPDVMSQYYVSCTLANFSSNADNHSFIVEEGGIQPVITLAYSPDPDVHHQAAAALRGLSATGSNKMKIVQEGGLEPIGRLLLSEDIEILREVTACLCNLSIGDENKIDIAKSGVIPPLVTHMQIEDMEVSAHSCACLANLAEISDNQELITLDGAICPCLSVMRSRYVEVQREAGRLLANLCACESDIAADRIIHNGGHQLLTSFLLSRDTASQRVGAFGVGNLCTHGRHRVTLMKSGVLEPLSALARSDNVDVEIQRFALLAIVNLASEVQNHQVFIQERTLPILVSLSNASDVEVRQYAAVAVAKIAKNTDFTKFVTSEGGLEPVLYLARTDEKDIRQEVLPAITSLSFLKTNQIDICKNGGLLTILPEIWSDEKNLSTSQLACCAVANLTEHVSNMVHIVGAGAIPLLVQAISEGSTRVQSEAARALGNLAANLDYGAIIMNHNVLPRFISLLKSDCYESQRMAAMALSNLSSNIKQQSHFLKAQIFDPLVAEFRASLDPKCNSDHETTRFCLMLIANLSTSAHNHSIILERIIDILIKFTGHRDIKCRQNAVFVLGNLCANRDNLKAIYQAGGVPVLISFAFPPSSTDSTNAQFQSIAGLRGLSMDEKLREIIVDEGCLEPLILAAGDHSSVVDIEVKREAVAVMCNLALSLKNKATMVESGVTPTLVSMVNSNDSISQVFAIGTLANLAERGGSIQARLLEDGCLAPLIRVIEASGVVAEVRREICRAFALFAGHISSHDKLMNKKVLVCLVRLMGKGEDCFCQRFGSLSIANLALFPSNHERLIEIGALNSLKNMAQSEDNETRRCVAFALHNISGKKDNHRMCEKNGVMQSLVLLLHSKDLTIKLQSAISVKYLSVSPRGRVQLVEYQGLSQLINLCKEQDLELKREATAALRNVSISDCNKIAIVKEGGVGVLVELCRYPDNKLSHQACGVIANISEASVNQKTMVHGGILHHLKFAMRSESTDVVREAVRALANLSSDFSCTELIVSAGVLAPLVKSLSSDDVLCRRFATLAVGNLATKRENQSRVVEEGGIQPLLSVASDHDQDNEVSRRYAYFALTNISASHSRHEELVEFGIIKLSFTFLKNFDVHLKLSAALCISNLASNKSNHADLSEIQCLDYLIPLINDPDRNMQLRTISSLRGLSTNGTFRNKILDCGALNLLLDLATIEDVEIQIETLATLCNVSLAGCIGKNPALILKKVEIDNLVSFLCSADSTYQLFGAVSIGNIASDPRLQVPVLRGGALNPLIDVANTVDLESQRCIAYALCNLCVKESNRMNVVNEGGLLPILSLACSDDTHDVLAVLTTIRGLATCPKIRRNIVVNGGLEPICIHIARGIDLECVKEALAAICALSLNDENKVSIVKSGVLVHLLKCTNSENEEVAQNSLRVFAICSEDESLHKPVFDELKGDMMINLVFSEQIEVKRQLSRFYLNLCGNLSMHFITTEANIHKALVDLCKVGDDIINRNAILGLLNLSTEESNHDELLLLGDTIVKFLIQIISQEQEKSSNIEFTIQSKRYACLAVGCLLQSNKFDDIFRDNMIINVISENLKVSDAETQLGFSFTLHKLAMKLKMTPLMRNLGLEEAILNFISSGCSATRDHAISSLRHISLDATICLNVVKNNGLSTLANAIENASDEMRRELAATFCHLSVCNQNKCAIAHSTALEPLMSLCTISDTETTRFAVAALANIAEDILSHDILVCEKNVLNFLSKMMKSKNVCTKREASRAVSNLLTTGSAQLSFLDEKGLESLQISGHCNDSECNYNCALSLHKLSSQPCHHDAIIISGSLQLILHLAKSKFGSLVARQAVAALRGLSSNHKFKLLIAEEGGLQTAIDLLSTSDLTLRILAAGVLRHLSISNRLKFPMCTNGLLEPLAVCVLDSHDNELLFQCAGTLTNISEHSRAKSLLWQEPIISALVKMSRSKDLNIQSYVARSFCFLSSEKESINQNLVLKSIEAVIGLLSSNMSVARDATIAIGNFLTDYDRQVLVHKLGAFPFLARLLSSSSEDCQIHACRALGRLMIPTENKSSFAGQNEALCQLVSFCWTENEEVIRYASMVLCNISTCTETQLNLLNLKGVEGILNLLASSCIETIRCSCKTLCNLAVVQNIRSLVIREKGVAILLKLLHHDDSECILNTIMALSNLSCGREHNGSIVASGCLPYLSLISCKTSTVLQRAVALSLYNLSTSESCHIPMAKESTIKSVVALCKSDDTYCRRYSVMTLCNLALNINTRRDATRGGGLQSIILMLNDEDIECKIYACVCLTNMANSSNTQSMIVLHGGLPFLVKFLVHADSALQMSAIMCIANISANTANHDKLLRLGVLKSLSLLATQGLDEAQVYCTFAIANMTSNIKILDRIGHDGGIKPLIDLSKLDSYHCKFIALTSLRRLAMSLGNMNRLFDSDVVHLLSKEGFTTDHEVQREVAACLCNLSQNIEGRHNIAKKCLAALFNLSCNGDTETIRQTVGTIGNLVESDEIHHAIRQHGITDRLIQLLTHESIDICRETSRALCNILTSCEDQEFIIEHGLNSLVSLCQNHDPECQHNSALACRKVVTNPRSHPVILNSVQIIYSLLQLPHKNTVKHAAAILRDLSANYANGSQIVETGGIDILCNLMKRKSVELQTLASSSLRHLSTFDDLKQKIMKSVCVHNAIKLISPATTEDLLCQLAGLLANLSETDRNQVDMVKARVIPAMLTLSRNKNDEIILDAVRTLANLSANEENQQVIYKQGGLQCLINLTGIKDPNCQRYISMALQFLMTNAGVRRAIMGTNLVEPIIMMSYAVSFDLQRSAMSALSSMSMEDNCKVELMRKGGFKAILALCSHPDLSITRAAVFAAANMSDTCDLHNEILVHGSIEVLKSAADSSSDSSIIRNCSRFFSSLSINDIAKDAIIKHGVVINLLKYARHSDLPTQRYSILAICNLSLSVAQKGIILQEDNLFPTLMFLARFPDLEVERCAVLAVAALSLGSNEEVKEKIAISGVFCPLLEFVRYPDPEAQQCASLALNSLILGKNPVIKRQFKTIDKGIPAIYSLLKTQNDECIHNGIYALGSMLESHKLREILLRTECIEAVLRVISSNSIEVKRACGYFFSVLAEDVETHTNLQVAGALEEIIKLASLVDLECQDYGAFSLAHLASNHKFQIPLVKLGAVRPLVSMMATEAEPQHYAGLALLKLADNFENHIAIAEEGGIQALLKLGKSRVTDGEVKYKAALTVGNLASNAVAGLPQLTHMKNEGAIGYAVASFRKRTQTQMTKRKLNGVPSTNDNIEEQEIKKTTPP